MQTITEYRCAYCKQPVELETAKSDEYGQAVHEECYVAKCGLDKKRGNAESRGQDNGNRNGGSVTPRLTTQILSLSSSSGLRRALDLWPYLFVAVSITGLVYIALKAAR